MANQTFRVLGPGLSPRPVWAVGELWIGGAGLARGYWRDQEKTATSFVEHPHSGERLYRTGDLGRFRPDGTIEFLGREDAQVKIRGHRIELGEIEATLARHPAVREAVADVRETPGGERALVAWAVPSSAGPDGAGAPVPTPWIEPEAWGAVTGAGREQSRRLLESRAARALGMEEAGEVDVEPTLDELARGYVIETFRRLGAFAEGAERMTPEELVARHGILERYTRLMREWLRTLADADHLVAEGEGFRAPRPLPRADLDEIWERLRAAGALTGGVGGLVRGSGDRLAEILRGEVEPLEVFFPGGDASAAEEFYESAHGSHDIAAAVVRAAAGRWPADRTLRALEIGAGTGGTTTWILPALPREGVEYTFTDVSRFFTRQAEEKLGDDPRLRFGVLDIDASPQRQGFAPHAYDLVVAANVLHNGRDLARTLDHVASLLAPGGLLVVEEATRWRGIFNVTIGLLEGLTRYEDGWRDGVPFASAGRWGEALLARGFEGFLALPESDEVHGHVLVARTPAVLDGPSPPFVDAEALSRHLAEHLPAYMVPAAFVPIARLPLTANGKVDRRALPEPERLAERRSGLVAPRTHTEATLAAIWQDVLGIAEVGVEDNFFDLGGDSILGVQIASTAARAGLPVAPRDLFEHQTVAELAVVAEAATASGACEAEPAAAAEEEAPDFSLVEGMSAGDLERAFSRVDFEE
jgi:SAM-dependent methyltransferase